MSSSSNATPIAVTIEQRGDYLRFVLEDGRRLDMPLTWYPRLCDATEQELANWEFPGEGEDVHWPDLDEDIYVKHVLEGRPSGESAQSLGRWLSARRDNRPVTQGAIHKYERAAGLR